jgi:arginyl-tRNA synthetase
MLSETSKNFISHLLASALSKLKLTSYLDTLDITVPPNEALGDYSTNAALVLAKKLKVNPKEVAAKIVDEINKIDLEGKLDAVTEQGGFVNFKFSQKFLLDNLAAIVEQRELYGCSVAGEEKTVIVEYFQNNVAKPPHVGHLRSAVIGDCLLRVLKSQGYKTVSDTHIGDWGVQFGILLYAFKTLKPDMDVLEKDPINELNKLYVEMSAKIEAEPELRDLAKQEFKKLEDGDEQNRKLWQWFVDESLKDFENYRALLGVLPFDYNLGESFYEKHMPEVLAEFQEKKIITTGETGETYVDLEKFGLGRCILVKSDGATTYHLRDFATYIYRKQKFNFYKNLYIVDNRQSHHFKQLFKALELGGYPAQKDSAHLEFGFMSLPEGAISTRKGTTVSLKNLINEAEKRAAKIIEEKNPDLENKQAVAKEVALAAIKYFDLSHNRKTEIVFTWDKALSFEGNTGPYLQYTHARIHGILRKSSAPTTPSAFGGHPSLAGGETATAVSPPFQGGVPSEAGGGGWSKQEISVMRKLVQFPEVLTQVAGDYLPNLLCNYLFELSQNFNSFYQEVPVLAEKDATLKSFRLQLITATAQVIKNGLYLLGIEAPEEM